MSFDESELRDICSRLVSCRSDEDDLQLLQRDPQLLNECRARLEAVGVRLHLPEQGSAVCVVDDDGEQLSDLSLACLTICVLALQSSSGRRRSRIEISELHKRVGEPHGYSEAYVRRAGLGPLEARGLVHVVKAAQQAKLAYIVAGPALGAIDVDGLQSHLQELNAA
jgi:hypothetical protein